MKQKPTILYLDHTAELGGGELALIGLIKNLDRSKFEPIIVLCTEGPLVEKFQSIGIEPVVLPISSDVSGTRKDAITGGSLAKLKVVWATVRYAGKLSKFIRQNRVDILHANSLKADIIGGIAGRMAGVKVIWHIRDRIEDDYLPSKVVLLFRWLADHLPHFIIANSHATLETLHLQHRPAQAIYSGIDLPEIFDTPADLNQPVIGLVGRITPWKGQHIFIDAAAKVIQTFPDAKFQIIGAPLFGEEDYLEQIKIQAEKLNISSSIEFLGFRKDAQALLSKMSIVVHASTTGEPFGQVVAQGMAAGKPVIGTNGGGVPELIVDGITGVLVPMGDSAAMAQAICSLLTDPVRCKSMGEAGRKRAAEKFTAETTTREVENVYNELTQSKYKTSIKGELE